MRIISFVFVMMTLSLVVLTSCHSEKPTSIITATVSPIQTTSPSLTSEAADDLVFTPGGLAYRANVHGPTPNPWPEIRSVSVTLHNLADYASVGYRDYIETNAGQTRNNIFSFFIQDKSIGNSVLTVVDLPVGLTASVDSYSSGPSNSPTPVLKIVIPNNVKPGYYEFNVDVQIDGLDYGMVLCIIRVL